MANTPLNNITIDGKLYDVLNAIPKKEHELIYTNKIDGEDTLVTKPLMLEDIYVVENEQEFIKCKGIEVSSPDIKNEWVQFSDSNFSPEYYKGASYYNDKHKPSSITYGYGYWDENNRNIKNKSNSCDYTGFINPQKSNKFNYTSIIGTDKGDITGGFGGVTLINDNYATPRHIIDTDGNIYYRNSLYDLTDNNGEKLSAVTDWCAWVNELNDGSANVLYSSMVSVSNSATYGSYEDDFPGKVGDLIDSYKIKDISSKNSRVNNREKNTQQITIQKCIEANGYIVVLNINTTNQTLGVKYNGYDNWLLGTIAVYANVLPCGYDKGINISSEHTYGKVKVNSSIYNYSPRNLTTHFVVANTGITGYDYMLGNNLVEVVPELNLYDKNDTGYAFIRSDVSFDNGVLNVKFSDLKGESGVTISDTDLSNLLSNENLNTNFPLNGSELIIDFNNGTCEMTGYTGTNYTDSININDITSINDYQYLLGKDEYGNNIIKNINVGDYFKRDENIKFMYHSCSFSNNYYKSNGFSYNDRLILDIENNKVWIYDTVEGDYKETVGEKPVDYFTGSRISYNDETKKLFYSNGTEITCIARNCGCGNDDTTNNINDSDIISVIIPEYEQYDEPVGLTSDDAGKYWYNMSSNLLYQYKYDFEEDGYKFVESDHSVKFINNTNDSLYVYSNENKIWDLNSGIENKIYVSTNTNEMYYWVNELSEFITFNGETDVLNSAIHFTEIGGVFEDTEDMPEASSVTYQYLLCKKNDPDISGSDIYYSLYKKMRLGRPIRIGWKSVIGDSDTVIKINNLDNEGDDLLFKKIEYDGNIFYEPKTIVDFLDNVYYINDNNGDVYSWNGFDLVKLTNDDLAKLLPKNNTFIVNFNSRHDLNLNKPFINYGGGAVVDDTDINSYTAEGEHTVIAINGETSKQTRFNLKIYEYDGYIYQDLYNNDVSYVRRKNNNWSEWNIRFTKTNLTLDVQQVSFSNNLNEKFNDKTIKEFDKKIQIKPKTIDDEFIKINEQFLYFNFYRRYNRHKKTKWWFVGRRVMPDTTTIPVMTTSNGMEYKELSFNLSDCNRDYKKVIYELPFTLKDLMNGLIKVSGFVNDSGTNVYFNDLNGVMKYGCGTEFAPNVKVWRTTINSKNNQFLTYGYKDEFKITDVSSPSISMMIGLNLSFGSHTSDGTEIIPYKIKVKFRHSHVDTSDWRGDIVYGMTNVLTNSVFK